MSPRHDGRAPDALRDIRFELGVQTAPAGSALIRWGGTHVVCSVSSEDKVPPHRLRSRGGWLTAEYAMLPGSTGSRQRRERATIGGRTAEIQRLIGRSLRAAIDIDAIGARTLTVDCDVLNADGGTRCASVTGGWVALAMALRKLELPAPRAVAAVSVGMVGGEAVVDLDYAEDFGCDVDMNCVGTPSGWIELQGTAEGRQFTQSQLEAMVAAARRGLGRVFEIQAAALKLLG